MSHALFSLLVGRIKRLGYGQRPNCVRWLSVAWVMELTDSHLVAEFTSRFSWEVAVWP
jgi:hypothetical protein